jgi:hypothetical protein
METHGGANRNFPNQPIGIGFQTQITNAYSIASVMSLAWSVFTHSKHGALWPGVNGFFCWCVLMGCAAFGNSEELLFFAFAWTGMLIVRRVEARELRKTTVLHSNYGGAPFWLMKMLKCSEILAKNIEPLLCMGVSYAVMQIHEAMGMLLMLSAVCMAFVRVTDAYANYKEAMAITDGEVIAQHQQWRREGWSEY